MKTFAAVFLLAAVAFAQDAPHPDQWHGLTLDVSTPADAAAALGETSTDKPDKLSVLYIGKWFDKEVQSKPVLRRMEFKSVDGFRMVEAYFRGDKLVALLLSFKDGINPTALKNIYGIDFDPYIGGFAEAARPQDFERHEGKVYPKTYPTIYSLAAVAEKSVIWAGVRNDGFSAILKDSLGARDTAGGGFPGKVTAVMLISRTLEDHKGADLLK